MDDIIQWVLLSCVFEVVSSGEYCNVFCSDGCCRGGCCPNKTAVGVGVTAGAIIGLFLIFIIVLFVVVYRRKKRKKKGAKVAVAEQEQQRLQYPKNRRILEIMENENCNVTFMRSGTKTIVIDVSNGVISIQKSDEIEVTRISSETVPRPQQMPGGILSRLFETSTQQ